MKSEQNLEKEKLDLGDYIKEKSEILIKKEDFSEELAGLAKPMSGMIGYYDSENIKFSVEGYDFVYFTYDGDLAHVKIKPDEISYLDLAGKLGEGDNLEDQFMGAGFIIDHSDKLRSALHRQLNKG